MPRFVITKYKFIFADGSYMEYPADEYNLKQIIGEFVGLCEVGYYIDDIQIVSSLLMDSIADLIC